MPPQAACPLDQQISRCQVADHQVEIQIQALLDDLGGDNNGPPRTIAIAAESPQHPFFQGLAPDKRKPGVEEYAILRLNESRLFDQLIDFLRAGNGVADHRCAAALREFLL